MCGLWSSPLLWCVIWGDDLSGVFPNFVDLETKMLMCDVFIVLYLAFQSMNIFPTSNIKESVKNTSIMVLYSSQELSKAGGTM